ncbi:MAG: VWA domain-containing protein, partial [Gemmatimonadetes bacterium]|nr:VWA domain-containing protein [Gemmatimonadota bacterium]
MPRRAEPSSRYPISSASLWIAADPSDSSWTLAQKMLRQTLEAYPTVKGIQVMNDDGVYMFRDYQARWMPDSPGRRQAIISRMRSWNATSDSNPVNGIEAAIRDFRSEDKKISIYVFGDDYQGVRSIDKAMAAIDRLSRPGPDGKRLIRIHGVGFPVR